MEQGNKGRAPNASYSLRRQVKPSKRFEDFHLEKPSLSKKKNLQTGEKLTWKSEEGSASSSTQTPLPMPILSGDTFSCDANSSALPQHVPGPSMPVENGCESTCKFSGPTSSTISEASECVGRRKKQVKPCQVDQAEQALENCNVPLVSKLCSPEQKSAGCLGSSQSHGEHKLTPVDSSSDCQAKPRKFQVLSCPRPLESLATPRAPKEKQAKVAPQGNHVGPYDLKRLEIAAILLQFAQQVPDLVPEVGCTVNLQQELQLIQEYSSKWSQNLPHSKAGSSVKAPAHKEASEGCSKKHHSTGKHSQKRKHLSSLDSGPVMGPEWMAARDREDMFFPHLEDSSLMAEAKERKRREMAQKSSLRQMAEPLEERYIKNAAVLPDLRPLRPVASSSARSSCLLSAALDEPLLIHGHTIENYQAIYHSVVDPKLKTTSGNAHRYNLEMGRAIKQHLWERMSCPNLVETVDADGRVHFTDSFSAPTLKSYAPQIDVDISGEPLPEQPSRKRARH